MTLKTHIDAKNELSPEEVEEALVDSGLLYAINRFVLEPFGLVLSTKYEGGQSSAPTELVLWRGSTGPIDEVGLPKLLRTLKMAGLDPVYSGQPIEEETAVMNYSTALQKLIQGKRIARSGWNGKGMWLELITNWEAPDAKRVRGENGQLTRNLPFIAMKTADNGLVPWLCSQTDALAEDWELVR